MKKKFYKETFVCCLILLIVMGGIFIRGTEHAEIHCEYENIALEECLVYMKGYEADDLKNFSVIEEDPQLLFDFTKLGKGKVRSVVLELDSKIEMPSVQLFYGRDTAEFSEMDSDILYGKDSSKVEVASKKSIEGFNFLRVDINQNFSLESVAIAYDYQIAYSATVLQYLSMALINVFLAVLFAFSQKTDDMRVYFWNKCKHCGSVIWVNKKLIAKLFIGIVGVFGIVLICEYIAMWKFGYINIYRVMIVTCAIYISVTFIMCRKIIWKYAHIYLFILMMVIGTITIITVPPSVGITSDDEIHYIRTANMSWGANSEVSYVDNIFAEAFLDMIMTGEKYNPQVRKAWENDINSDQKEYLILGSISNSIYGGSSLDITSVAYIPGAIGLIIGRGIGLNFTSTFMLGKWMNLLYYATLFSLAIKITKGRGKILIAAVGIIPTNLFTAASYSCDCWIISFVVLAYALFIKEIREEGKIKTKKFSIIMLFMIIGLLPKAVYFPLIFPMMFIKKEKCENVKQIRMFVIVAMLFLIGTFILPMIFGGAGTGDTRGGDGVNSTEQIKFILENPIQYTQILLNFLRTYLSPDEAYRYLTFLLYYGQAEYYTICLLVLGIVAILDNEEETGGILVRQKIMVILSCFAAITLAATAMYISFTAVGSEVIAGCQPRYILPTIFPFLFFIGKFKLQIDEGIKRNIYAISTVIMTYVYLWGIYSLRVCYF